MGHTGKGAGRQEGWELGRVGSPAVWGARLCGELAGRWLGWLPPPALPSREGQPR